MSLTGGTRDVNPQWLTFSASQSAADTTTTTQQNIPIQRLPTAGRAQVLEVLKVWFENRNGVVESDNTLQVFLTTKNFGTTAVLPNEPTCLAFWKRQFLITTSGSSIQNEPMMINLDDGAGHGLIVATDAIFLQVQSSSTAVTNIVDCKIMYRWKNVSLAEYIGVVQSQQ